MNGKGCLVLCVNKLNAFYQNPFRMSTGAKQWVARRAQLPGRRITVWVSKNCVGAEKSQQYHK